MEQPNTPTPAAPAQPVSDPTPTSLSAVNAAVASGDTGAYRAARRAERAGKPLPEVAVTPAVDAKVTETPATETAAEPTDPAAPAQPVAEQPKPSRKEREQQEANERVRRAVEAATADLRAEVERLKGGKPAADPAAPAQPEKPKAEKFQSLAEWSAANPEGTLEQYMDARDEFRDQQRRAADAERSVGDALEADTVRAIESFDARVVELEKAKPDVRRKIAPLAQALGKRGGPFGVVARIVGAIADGRGADVLEHFADNPEALKSIVTLPERLRGLPLQVQVAQHSQHIALEIGRLQAKLDTPSAPAKEPVQPKTLTDAPEPAQTLGTKPATAADPKVTAIRKGDTRAYRELRRQERAAGRR